MGARLASSDAEAIHTHTAGTFFPVVSARLSQLQSRYRRQLDVKREEHTDSDPESDQDKSEPMVRACSFCLKELVAVTRASTSSICCCVKCPRRLILMKYQSFFKKVGLRFDSFLHEKHHVGRLHLAQHRESP